MRKLDSLRCAPFRGTVQEVHFFLDTVVGLAANSRAGNLKYSSDGYVRLTFSQFIHLAFPHKLAWEDRALCEELLFEDIPASRAGYCEWATDNVLAQVSIGWAWFCFADERKFLVPGGVSSNVMLLTEAQYDMGAVKTSELLQAWISSQHWQSVDTADDCEKFRISLLAVPASGC